MNNKDGQITLFILLGMMIIFAIGIGFYVMSFSEKNSINTEIETNKNFLRDSDQIKSYIDSCLHNTAYNGLEIIGEKGGYVNIPKLLEYENTSYWYLDQVNVQPSLDEIRIKLQDYIDQNLQDCINYTIFENRGFDIKDDEPKSEVSFNLNDVNIKLNYSVDIKRYDNNRNFNFFNDNQNIRFRKVYEMASQVLNRLLEPQFEFSNPLKYLYMLDLDIVSANQKDDILIYTITDNTIEEKGIKYSFNFASRHIASDLKRTVFLQNNSISVPTVLPYIIYSIDRMANLFIMPKTTMAKDNKSVESISVQQFYMPNITRYNVPMHETGDDSIIYGNLTWISSYPIYEFEPTGLRFNNPQILALYWDDDKTPNKGNMGMLYDEGKGWRPLPSKADYNNSVIYTAIPGFSRYTVVDGGIQPKKDISATAKISPGLGCWAKQAAMLALVTSIDMICPVPGATTSAYIGSNALGLSPGLTSFLTGTLFVGKYLMKTHGSEKDTITFTPTCDQTIIIKKDIDNGKGKCYPSEGNHTVEAGIPISLSAVIKKCKKRHMPCGKCKLTCSTTYK